MFAKRHLLDSDAREDVRPEAFLEAERQNVRAFSLAYSKIKSREIGPERRLVFSKPFLPQFLPQVSIRDLKVGDASVDLLLTRHDEGDVGVNVLRRNGILDVVVLK